MIAAIVHSQGFVINKMFYCLEFSYTDILERRHHFFVESPFTFSNLKFHYPLLPITVTVNPPMRMKYNEVLKFLRLKYRELEKAFPDRRLFFGYKGKSYQLDILYNAGIEKVMNVENLGVPSIQRLTEMYPEELMLCRYHPRRETRCAERTVRLVIRYMKDHVDKIAF